MGIGPTSRPWQGRILPVNYTRKLLKRMVIISTFTLCFYSTFSFWVSLIPLQ